MLIALRINTKGCCANFYYVSFNSVNIQSLHYNMTYLYVCVFIHAVAGYGVPGVPGVSGVPGVLGVPS